MLRFLTVFLLFASGLHTLETWAAPIAIIDSDIDLDHELLKDHVWTNSGRITGNPFTNDVHGWNFVDNNNELINLKLLNQIPPDIPKFFEVADKVMSGMEEATQEEKDWFFNFLQTQTNPKEFLKEIKSYSYFVHGTHVAGIASKDSPQAKIMGIKFTTPDEEPLIQSIDLSLHGLLSPFSALILTADQTKTSYGLVNPTDELQMQETLDQFIEESFKKSENLGHYVSITGMKVANCSFSTDLSTSKAAIKELGKKLLDRDLSQDEIQSYVTYFSTRFIKKGSGLLPSATNTLFVIAAGNNKSDNDQSPVYPGNSKSDNSITVAATQGDDKLASFSNYGATTVDIAAPGVAIISSIPSPDNKATLAMSGTSMAAPKVANIAGKIWDTNPTLSPLEVKTILMQTVDKKPFLNEKVVSQGIVNEERATQAANYSKSMTVAAAIAHAAHH